MFKLNFFLIVSFYFLMQPIIKAQDSTKHWKTGGALGMDLAQLIFVNPKVGAGENRLGLGVNSNFFANYKKDRIAWNSKASLAFGIQRLGRGKDIPFQKSVDELRISSLFNYALTKESPLGYSMDFLLLSQLTPTYDGNYLSPQENSAVQHPVAQFFSPVTITVSPGISYQKATDWGTFSVLLSPASLKMLSVANDSIARLGLHGNPLTTGGTAKSFKDDWRISPPRNFQKADGTTVFYAPTYLQLGATLKANYAHKLWKYKEGDKDKHRIVLSSQVNLYSNYLREAQNIDVEWICNFDFYIIKGLSLSLKTNLFYDHDVFVQLDRDGDITTGTNGYESTGRRLSFMEQILIKYNFLF